MTRTCVLCLLLMILPGFAPAQTAMEKAAGQGRAMAEDLLVQPGSSLLTGDKIGEVVTPYRTDTPSEAGISSAAIEDEAARRAAGSSVEGRANQAVVQSSSLNPRREMTASDPSITRADQLEGEVNATAGSLFSVTGSDNPVCTLQGIGNAGKVERNCERVVSIDEYMCRKVLNVTVERDTTYQCDITRNTDGTELSNACSTLASQSACTETSSSCLNLVDGNCLSARKTYVCTNVSGAQGGAVEIKTSSPRIRGKTEETCDPGMAGGSCARSDEVCTAGPSTRVINGVPVTRDCWAWEQPVACEAEGLNSDCAVLANDPSCTRIKEECILTTEDGSCLQYEDRYRCEGTPGQAGGSGSCKKMTVCAGGYCEEVTPEPANTDFGQSSAWLGVLDEMAKDAEKNLETQDLRVFDGMGQGCRVGALGVLNCCKDSGWGNGIIGQCTEEEFALMDRMDAESVHYIGTYCSKRLFVCVQKKRVYCAFNSKLARVFVEQFRNISGKTWGTPKTQYTPIFGACPECDHGTKKIIGWEPVEGTGPQCQGITIEEMEEVDMEDIDLSEAFADFVEGANIPAMSTIRNVLTSRLGGN